VSKVYEYITSTFSNYLIENLDCAGGYDFIRNAALNLQHIGFEYFRTFIDFPSLDIYLPPDPLTQALFDDACELYNAGELKTALPVLNNCLNRSKNEGDPILHINSLYLVGRINHDIGESGKADKLYDEVLELSEQYDYPPAFLSAVHEKARLAVDTYKLLEAESGFRIALDYYAGVKEPANAKVARSGLRRVAETLMLFSRGPVEAIEFLKSLKSNYLSHEDDTGYEFLEVRSLAIYGLATIPEHRDYVANLVQKAFKLKDRFPRLSDLSLDEAGYISQFTGDGHVAAIKYHLKNANRVKLRTEPFKIGSGKYDDSNPFSSPRRAAGNISMLYSFLRQKDKEGSYVYRGQTQEYDAPLLPSAFRDIMNLEFDVEYKDSSSRQYEEFGLRKCGSSFIGEYNRCFSHYCNPVRHLEIAGKSKSELEFARDTYGKILINYDILSAQQYGQSYVPWMKAIQNVLSENEFDVFQSNKAQWMTLINNFHKRVYRTGPFFRLFGYALGTTFAQQYGLSSEGLDATKSLDVSCFFATHTSEHFQSIQNKGIGIIYRFPYEPSDIVASRLDKLNYYNMPSVVDLQDIMYRFEKIGFDREESIKCFEYYFGSVFTKSLNNLDLLFLPEGFFETTRMSKQQSVIVFPDEIREDMPDREPGNDGIVFPKYRYIEDLAKRKGLEKFYFQHTGTFPSDAKQITREILWPRNDDMLPIIVGIIMAQYPLSMSLPQRLDLIDGGYERDIFVDYCESLSQKHKISLFDGYSKITNSIFPLSILPRIIL
jgi:hypothetical protein